MFLDAPAYLVEKSPISCPPTCLALELIEAKKKCCKKYKKGKRCKKCPKRG